jgi:sigma-54 dependent transcriptional regulator, acetoin dehydrogenase operon transcriptional activator AcoR
VLRLVEEEPGLWERFQQEPEAVSPVLVPGATHLLPRWQRSRELGVAADGQAHPLGVASHDLVVRRDGAVSALRGGAHVIEALEADMSPRGLLTLVTDASGVIVRARGGDAFAAEVRRTRLVEGARWDEGARGTNAIGTAIVEARPIAVVGRAHFEAVNHGLFCYAAPVLDPFGEVVAVLDVTGPLSLETASISSTVRGAASAIEALLHAHAYGGTGAGSRALLERMLERTSSPALLLEAPGRVQCMNDAAAAELDLRGDMSVERLFGLAWPELVRASSAGKAIFETRRRRFEVEFEPVLDARGRTLALVCFLEREAARARPRRISSSPPAELAAPFDAIVAVDPHVVEAKRATARLAASDVPILLLAETGTGKELFAKAIHQSSKRASRAFIPVNCGALAGSLLESELFGYAPGAFTGANRGGAEGKLAAANGGTLFLDELAEMPPAAQAMLLRFLEDGTYTRIGESTPRRADVRLVAATCRDLPKLVEDGSFRSDLFYRIHGGCVRLPPLRQRVDRLELARALVAGSATALGIARPPELGASAEAWILDHSWPGNVRELKSAIQHAMAMSPGRCLEADDFPEPLVTSVPGGGGSGIAEDAPRQRALRTMAEAALARAGGNMSEAARALGVARSTLYRMLKASPSSSRSRE